MAEVTGMTPEKIAQEITNVKSYVNGGLSEKADKTQVASDLSKKADKTQVASDLSKKTDKTYVDSGLSKKADITYVDSLSPLKSFVGSGFPEGKVAAPVGSIYTDSAATNGAIRWIKASGTGTTGWKVEYGDTGWRDITSTITDRTTPLEFTDGSKLLIRRIGTFVHLKILGVVYVRTSFGKVCDAITGFRSHEYVVNNFSKNADLSPGIYQIRIDSGVVNATLNHSADRSILAKWDTAQSWPTTLPGTPA